jgi:hypothetical protein
VNVEPLRGQGLLKEVILLISSAVPLIIQLDTDLILLHAQVHGLAEFLFVQAKLHFH